MANGTHRRSLPKPYKNNTPLHDIQCVHIQNNDISASYVFLIHSFALLLVEIHNPSGKANECIDNTVVKYLKSAEDCPNGVVMQKNSPRLP